MKLRDSARSKNQRSQKMTDSELVALEKVTRHALRLRECEGLGRKGEWRKCLDRKIMEVSPGQEWGLYNIALAESCSDAEFIAAANPKMVMEMIHALRHLRASERWLIRQIEHQGQNCPMPEKCGCKLQNGDFCRCKDFDTRMSCWIAAADAAVKAGQHLPEHKQDASRSRPGPIPD